MLDQIGEVPIRIVVSECLVQLRSILKYASIFQPLMRNTSWGIWLRSLEIAFIALSWNIWSGIIFWSIKSLSILSKLILISCQVIFQISFHVLITYVRIGYLDISPSLSLNRTAAIWSDIICCWGSLPNFTLYYLGLVKCLSLIIYHSCISALNGVSSHSLLDGVW